MIRRREAIMGAAAAVAAGAAYALTPKKRVSLVGSTGLDQVVPARFGDWISRDISDPMALNSEDSLAARLYSQLITRLYTNPTTGRQIVVLLAYGAEQTDDLQLHRPEVCYPAFGYEITDNKKIGIPLPSGGTIPARRLITVAEARSESIIYWTRLGEYLPRDGSEQRKVKLETAFRGEIADGVLCRFSMSLVEPDPGDVQLKSFATTLVSSIAPEKRKLLIGTQLGDTMLKVPGAAPESA